ncbi:MAG: hypothetical protein ACK4J0_01570 [Candidatus Anstonellaceae archaeon]
MVISELKFLAKYPFLSQAKEYIKNLNVGLEGELLELGKERIKQGLKEGQIKSPIILSENDLKNYILSYAASRIILSNWKNVYARQRMAIVESKRAADYLKNEEYENIKKIAQEFQIEFFWDQTAFYVDIVSYLKYSPKDIHYKLLYMPVKKGQVRVLEKELIRLFEEAIKLKLEKLPQTKLNIKELDKIIKELQDFLPKQKMGEVKINTSDFPPCIKKLLAQLSSSINVPHNGRVALAIYLIKAGFSDEQIQKVFSFAPDYDFETTKYQIEFIRKKNYQMPSCSTMDSYGLCIADCKCFNPIKFRRKFHQTNAKNSIIAEDEEYAN